MKVLIQTITLCLSLYSLSASAVTIVPSLQSGSTHGNVRPYKASFKRDWMRYPSPDVVIKQLLQNFSLLGEGSTMYDNKCGYLDQNNRSVLGDNNPTTGAPLVDNPNMSFVVWYTGCLQTLFEKEYVLLSTNTGSREGRLQYMGKPLIDACGDAVNAQSENLLDHPYYLSNCKWSSISTDLRRKKVLEFIDELIGPTEVVADLQIASSSEELADIIQNSIQHYQENPDDRYKFLRAEGELNVINALQAIRFLILMTDTMRF
jgi:hypothetical protein